MSKKKREMDTMPFVWLMFTFPFVLISAWMIAEGIPVLYTCILFKQDGVSTIGTALTTGRKPQFRRSWGLPAKIEFKDHNGMVHTFLSRQHSGHYDIKPGDTISVTYYRPNPEIAAVEDRTDIIFVCFCIIWIFFSLSVHIGGWVWLYRSWREYHIWLQSQQKKRKQLNV